MQLPQLKKGEHGSSPEVSSSLVDEVSIQSVFSPISSSIQHGRLESDSTINDIKKIIHFIGGKNTVFLKNLKDSDVLITGGFTLLLNSLTN